VNGIVGGPRGPRSSSYATLPDGLAAYADLLSASGHPVRRLTGPLSRRALDPAATLVLIDPDTIDGGQAAALRSFVASGGRLVAGGSSVVPWMAHMAGSPPTWSSLGTTEATPLAPVPEVDGVRRVVASGSGTWTQPHRWLPALGSARGDLLVVAAVGAGRVALLADGSVLQNRFLSRADNAALGLALAGSAGRAVDFAEGVHGYGAATGLAAVPSSWRWGLGALVVAALALMVARGRRLGPPEPATRPLPPPRRAYVEALAALLAETKAPGEAVRSVQETARRRLAERAGLSQDADPSELGAAAQRLGLPTDQTRALLEPIRDEAGVVAAGRGLADLEQGARQAQ
jgi:hypothetical protein